MQWNNWKKKKKKKIINKKHNLLQFDIFMGLISVFTDEIKAFKNKRITTKFNTAISAVDQ